jgi:hypothetical protein
MSHPEKDYAQVLTALDHTSYGWLPRPSAAVDIADGDNPWIVLAQGPFNVAPGEVVPLVFALLAGENVHTDPDNFIDNFSPFNPTPYLENVNFEDLVQNTIWASWLYDNPGYDTDGDGYRGEFYSCCTEWGDMGDVNQCLRTDTFYYKGDGVPDYSAVSPPIPPQVFINTGVTGFNSGFLVVTWNGFKTEMTPDRFTGELDFEGYRVYLSPSPHNADFIILSSYDKEDYTRYTYFPDQDIWLVVDQPYSVDSLRQIYGPEFHPLDYQSDNPLFINNPDGSISAYYFTNQDWNYSCLADTNQIHKVYPEQPYPSTLDLDSARIYFPEELTDDGDLKYFEYKYTINNLMASRKYYVSVTAFDYGSPGKGIDAIETKPVTNMVAAYAQNEASLVEDRGLNVVVYPNPYRSDGRYRELGLEGRGQEDMIDDRVRAVHFTNLPHKCVIRIFSIDGDLVRKIDHNYPERHPEAMHDIWDVITRNTQRPVSGIYYWVVESDYGSQMGKLVLIM